MGSLWSRCLLLAMGAAACASTSLDARRHGHASRRRRDCYGPVVVSVTLNTTGRSRSTWPTTSRWTPSARTTLLRQNAGDVTINGGGRTVALAPGEQATVFLFAGSTVSISDLTVTGGNAGGEAGAIDNLSTGSLTLTNVTIEGNHGDGASETSPRATCIFSTRLSATTRGYLGRRRRQARRPPRSSTNSVAVYGSTIDNNDGGGISVEEGPITVTDSTVTTTGEPNAGGINAQSIILYYADVVDNAATTAGRGEHRGRGLLEYLAARPTVDHVRLPGRAARRWAPGFHAGRCCHHVLRIQLRL